MAGDDDVRSRSPRPDSERRRDRDRSRSPRRKRDDKPKGGFKWKEKSRPTEENGEEERGLKRGYRDNRPPPRRPREEETVRASGKPSNGERDDGVAQKFGDGAKANDEDKPKEKQAKKEKKEKKEKKYALAPTQEPMIIVTVNDRLGTKAQIPCLASDPVKLFKAQVAARIGRQPHEIMLKRQGERPFKDQLTLEDYGVSNGVQLDLELDTGD